MTLSGKKYEALKRSDFFRPLPDSDLAALAESMQIESFENGELVCSAGDVADRVFVVMSGSLNANLPGQDAPVRTMQAGDVIGEYGLFAEEVRSADVVCTTQSDLMSLDYSRFEAFLELFPNTTYALLKQTVRRLLALEKRDQKQDE